MRARLQPRERPVTLSSTPQDRLTYSVAPWAPVFSKVKIMEQVGRISLATYLARTAFARQPQTIRRHIRLWIECHDGKLGARLEGSQRIERVNARSHNPASAKFQSHTCVRFYGGSQPVLPRPAPSLLSLIELAQLNLASTKYFGCHFGPSGLIQNIGGSFMSHHGRD
jgi:hypothetical protein